ncbi:MAG: GNAT family N-acetyltransferase [Candidatus Niyogibacteria bacterium]|nr:MAG: GNAT family N-acetyltransferase [Candidatus Niyogibacteria bacterium]
MAKFLPGKRIRLRQIQIKDALPIITLLGDNPGIASNLVFFSDGAPSLEREAAWIEAVTKRPYREFVFVAETLEKDVLIGTVGIHDIDDINRNARVGIMIINKDFTGKGYAQEMLEILHKWVFEYLKLNKVYMNFRVDNARMRHVTEKFGYCEVGVLKNEYFWKGQWLDFVRYELTADRWREFKNAP